MTIVKKLLIFSFSFSLCSGRSYFICTDKIKKMTSRKSKNHKDVFAKKIKNINNLLVSLFSSMPCANPLKKYSFLTSYKIYWNAFHNSSKYILENYSSDMTDIPIEYAMIIGSLFNNSVGKPIQWKMYTSFKECIVFMDNENILKFYEIYNALEELIDFSPIFSPMDEKKPCFMDLTCHSLQGFSMFDDLGVFFYFSTLILRVINNILKIFEKNITKQEFIDKVKEEKKSLIFKKLIKHEIRK